MMRLLSVFLLFFAGPAMAGDVTSSPGAVLRGLDKVDGRLTDMDLRNGQSHDLGYLTVTLRECRYPAGNPSGNAYANVLISEKNNPEPVFSGWMIATAPALNALDHPRYDVWVLRCKTE